MKVKKSGSAILYIYFAHMTSYRKSLAQNPNICSASRNLRSTFHERSRKEKASFVPLKSGILSVWKCCEIQRKKSRPATQTKPLSKLQSTWACTIKINQQQYVHVQMCTCVQCTCLCVCLKTFKTLKMKLIRKPGKKQLHGFSPPMNKSDSLVPRHPPPAKDFARSTAVDRLQRESPPEPFSTSHCLWIAWQK